MLVAAALATLLVVSCRHAESPAIDAASDASPDAMPVDCLGAGVMNEVARLVVSDKQALFDVVDGGGVPLRAPTQLGEYLFVAARVRTSAPRVKATADLRDPTSHRILALDARDLTLTGTADGWAEPMGDLESNTANVSVCPNFVEPYAMNGAPFILELAIAGDAGPIACLSATVIPECAAGDTYCPVVCAAPRGIAAAPDEPALAVRR